MPTEALGVLISGQVLALTPEDVKAHVQRIRGHLTFIQSYVRDSGSGSSSRSAANLKSGLARELSQKAFKSAEPVDHFAARRAHERAATAQAGVGEPKMVAAHKDLADFHAALVPKAEAAKPKTVASDWVDQPTTGEVSRELRARHGVGFAAGQVDPALANAIARGVHESMKLAPGTKVSAVRIGELARGMGPHTLAHTDYTTSSVVVSPDFKNRFAIADRLKQTQETGHNAPGSDTVEGIVAHEVGHFVHREYQKRKLGDRKVSVKLGDMGTNNRLEAQRRATREVTRLRSDLADGELRRILAEHGGADTISKYAGRSTAEAAAEAFSEVVTQGDKARPVSKALVQELTGG